MPKTDTSARAIQDPTSTPCAPARTKMAPNTHTENVRAGHRRDGDHSLAARADQRRAATHRSFVRAGQRLLAYPMCQRLRGPH
jgi:hypothetical protein